jgi:hypothetical protein
MEDQREGDLVVITREGRSGLTLSTRRQIRRKIKGNNCSQGLVMIVRIITIAIGAPSSYVQSRTHYIHPATPSVLFINFWFCSNHTSPP